MNRLAALVLIALSFSAQAAEPDMYFTFQGAAYAGLQKALALTADYEAGGVVYQCGQMFTYSEPTTDNRPDIVGIRMKPRGACSIVAIYHTHPKGDNQFSINDVRGICLFRIRGVVQSRTGPARVFDCRKDFEHQSMEGELL